MEHVCESKLAYPPGLKWTKQRKDVYHVLLGASGPLSPAQIYQQIAVDGEMDLGEFGRIHFIDWDQTRGRTRTVQVMIIGE